MRKYSDEVSQSIGSLKGVGEIAPRLQPMRHDRSLEPMMVASFLCMNKNMLTRFCWYCEFKCFKGGPEGCKNPACAATLVSYLLIGMVTIAPLFNSTNCIETHTKLLTWVPSASLLYHAGLCKQWNNERMNTLRTSSERVKASDRLLERGSWHTRKRGWRRRMQTPTKRKTTGKERRRGILSYIVRAHLSIGILPFQCWTFAIQMCRMSTCTCN